MVNIRTHSVHLLLLEEELVGFLYRKKICLKIIIKTNMCSTKVRFDVQSGDSTIFAWTMNHPWNDASKYAINFLCCLSFFWWDEWFSSLTHLVIIFGGPIAFPQLWWVERCIWISNSPHTDIQHISPHPTHRQVPTNVTMWQKTTVCWFHVPIRQHAVAMFHNLL